MHVQWTYGPNSGLAHNAVQAEERALRFTCRTEGGTRKVYIGPQHPDHTVEMTAMARMRIALPLHAVPPSPHRLNVIESTVHLVPLTASDAAEPSWLIEAAGFTPLPVRSDPRWPDLRPTNDCPTQHAARRGGLVDDHRATER